LKLLFDENLSERLVRFIAEHYPGSAHVEHVLGRRRTDEEIWSFARSSGYVIVSKDNDFRQRAFLIGPPPKVIWLSVGNAGTDQIAAVLRSRAADIERFEAAEEEALLVIEAPTD
jgi:predicted nuclease of predicted toxin-antitoxin system